MTLVSSQKICSGDPTFENLGGTYPPKSYLSTPSPCQEQKNVTFNTVLLPLYELSPERVYQFT